MIKYSLKCDHDHAFDSWFRDILAFDTLAAAEQLCCPLCGSASVEKTLMAPSIVRGPRKADRAQVTAPEVAAPPSSPEQPIAMIGEEERNLRGMIRALHRKIVATAENVGRAFPEEARRIHEGEVPARSIYGQATGEEVKALLEDGVALLPMPSLPDDQH